VAVFRSQVDAAWMQGVNRISGAILLAFGLFSIWGVCAK